MKLLLEWKYEKIWRRTSYMLYRFSKIFYRRDVNGDIAAEVGCNNRRWYWSIKDDGTVCSKKFVSRKFAIKACNAALRRRGFKFVNKRLAVML